MLTIKEILFLGVVIMLVCSVLVLGACRDDKSGGPPVDSGADVSIESGTPDGVDVGSIPDVPRSEADTLPGRPQ